MSIVYCQSIWCLLFIMVYMLCISKRGVMVLWHDGVMPCIARAHHSGTWFTFLLKLMYGFCVCWVYVWKFASVGPGRESIDKEICVCQIIYGYSRHSTDMISPSSCCLYILALPTPVTCLCPHLLSPSPLTLTLTSPLSLPLIFLLNRSISRLALVCPPHAQTRKKKL